MTVIDLPEVHTCSVEGCSYNSDAACHAGAITVSGDQAACGTFIDIGGHGGLSKTLAKVGACHRADCTHNDNLECGAESISVGPGADAADCLTYEPA
ncbi:MAG: DUF1540 domain-containing protein [Aeromicrobium sp.]